MLCAKFGSNCPSCSGEEAFDRHYIFTIIFPDSYHQCTCILLLLSPLEMDFVLNTFEQIWIPFTQVWLKLVQWSDLQKKAKMWKVYNDDGQSTRKAHLSFLTLTGELKTTHFSYYIGFSYCTRKYIVNYGGIFRKSRFFFKKYLVHTT